MYVPNYIPGPLEVPGNVSTQRYPVRLAFIRRVTLLHAFSLLGIAGLVHLPLPAVGVGPALLALVASFLLLDFHRILWRGQPHEATSSAYGLAPVMILAALAARELLALQIPVWAMLYGPIVLWLYTLLCGRDYSFVGAGFFAVLIGTISLMVTFRDRNAWLSETEAIVANLCYTVYLVYDLAYLMHRRRRGEEPAAVVDLYRDVFNLLGYIPRVISHWRRHRIWERP